MRLDVVSVLTPHESAGGCASRSDGAGAEIGRRRCRPLEDDEDLIGESRVFVTEIMGDDTAGQRPQTMPVGRDHRLDLGGQASGLALGPEEQAAPRTVDARPLFEGREQGVDALDVEPREEPLHPQLQSSGHRSGLAAQVLVQRPGRHARFRRQAIYARGRETVTVEDLLHAGGDVGSLNRVHASNCTTNVLHRTTVVATARRSQSSLHDSLPRREGQRLSWK